MALTADDARKLKAQAGQTDPETEIEKTHLTQAIKLAAGSGEDFVYFPALSAGALSWLKGQGFGVEIVPIGDGDKKDWRVNW